VYALAVLGLGAAYGIYSNFFAGPSYKPVTPPPVRSDSAEIAIPGPEKSSPGKSSGPDISQAKGKVERKTSSKSKNGEFRPIYIPKKKEDRVDVTTVDPTIRFDLLKKAMQVPPAGGERDLFQISKTPPIKTELASAQEPKIHPFIPYGPHMPEPPRPVVTPPPPPPTPIPLKYYGISSVHPDGTRTAYFMSPGPDGDEIFMANEGTVIKGRYRIVQIAMDKVTVEDIQDKRRQPVNIEKEATQ
jgi:hypothetical protein